MSGGNEKRFRVLVTTLGRGHFIQVASSLVQAGVDATLFQGWIVKNPRKSLLLKIAAKIVGRQSLIYGFEKRMPPELQGRTVGDFLSDFTANVTKMVFERFSIWGWHFGCKVGFALHGFRTRRLLRKGGYDVFQVRSGFGAGGAIEAARRKGVKVLVDHSAGAPQFVVEKVYGLKLEPRNY